MDVVTYARFSPRPEGARCESIEEQVEAMLNWCNARDHRIVAGAFIDRMISGAAPIEERPGLLEALGTIKRGQALLVRRLDRLARDTLVLLNVKRTLEKLGCRLVSIEGEGTAGTEPQDVFTLTIMGASATLDRAMIALRTKIAMARHQRNGRRMGHIAPFGTQIVNDDDGRPKLLRACDAEVLAVRRMKELRKNGYSYRSIAKALTAEGFSPRGSQWWHTTVSAVLNRKAEGSERSEPT